MNGGKAWIFTIIFWNLSVYLGVIRQNFDGIINWS